MCKIKDLKQKLIMTFVVLIVAFLRYLLKIPCPILAITGVRCIGCGITRAILSAVQWDFASAFSFNKMFWSLPILYLFFLYDGKLFKSKRLNISILVAILIGFILNWGYYAIFCWIW